MDGKQRIRSIVMKLYNGVGLSFSDEQIDMIKKTPIVLVKGDGSEDTIRKGDIGRAMAPIKKKTKL